MSLFQSLIGTIKTHTTFIRFWFRKKFQSLIGTIKTEVDRSTPIEVTRVSIPHRYDKNGQTLGKALARVWFQSLIGTIKTIFRFWSLIDFSEFQSLIGTIKTDAANGET